jgi:DNA end-binding protein Ku
VYFDKPYYLEPQKGGERAYALMRDALSHSGKVGIAKVVLKSREHLAAVKPVGKMIMLGMMRFAHEIVNPNELQLPDAIVASGKEMDLARTLIDSMTDTFDPQKYKDDYYEKVLAVIQAKIEGVSLKPGAPAAKKPGKVVDLMEVLKQSLAETQKKEPAGAGRARKAK